MTFQPRVFTFYSYKGGVGRSMALLNTAYYLHARGRHVLIVDLDLEAPGASGFLRRTDELLPREGGGDVVDVLAAVVASARATGEEGQPSSPALRLESFLRSVDPSRYALAVHPRAPRARLDVLAADESRDYTTRLSALELSTLTGEEIALASDLLRSLLLRHRFPFQQPWLPDEAPPEDTPYDYILVDSRTGLSEIGGLCVGPLSDRLVVLSGLNEQNIDGTRNFLRLVGLEPKVRSVDTEAWDDADFYDEAAPRPATLGPKPTLLVASPVPGGEITYKKERMEALEQAIGLAPVKLSYHPQMALMETIFVRNHVDEYLALEYATLGSRIMGMIGDAEDQLRAPIGRLFGRKRRDEETEADDLDLPRRFARIALASGQAELDMPLWMLRPSSIQTHNLDQLRLLSVHLARTDEQAAQAWLSWADELDTEEARASGDSTVFEAMEDKYRKAISLKKNFHEALNNWGIALSDWARRKEGSEADSLFAQAAEKYRQALTIKPDDHEALYNWGNALSDWALRKEGSEADSLFTQAEEKYQQALAIKPDMHEALYNWGAALSDWARRKEGSEADSLFAQAAEKCLQALTIKPDMHEALYNLACIAGLRNDVQGAMYWLERWSKANPAASRKIVESDGDFDPIREDPSFRAALARLRPE